MHYNRTTIYTLITVLGIITLVMLTLLYCHFLSFSNEISQQCFSIGKPVRSSNTTKIQRYFNKNINRRKKVAKVKRKNNKTKIRQQIETSTPTKSPTLTPNSTQRSPPEIKIVVAEKIWQKKKKSPKIDLQKISGISNIKTSELTKIYKLPLGGIAKPNEFVASLGYVFGGLLGRGSYASVFKMTRTSDNEVFACKVIDISSANANQSQSLKSELFILERVCHPNIIQLHRHFIVDATNVRILYIFMQFAQGDSMSAHVRKNKHGQPESICKRWFAQVLSAIKHMHMLGIAHRDLKMGNILLNETLDCLVTDFGLSRVAFRRSRGGTILSHTFCGTVPYMAPEVLVNRHYQVDYDPFMADIWALGVVLYCLINRGYPFTEGPTMYDQQMAHEIKMSTRIIFKANLDLIDLLNSMLHPVVSKRATIYELMKSPWAKKEFDIAEKKAQRFAQIIKLQRSLE